MAKTSPLIYKEPMKVICINTKNSKKLIKDAIYYATSIGSDYNNNTDERYIRISIGKYSLNCFTSIDGNSLKNEPAFVIEQKSSLDFSKDYTDQCVRCSWSSSKVLKNGEIYYVESQRMSNRKDWRGTLVPYHQIKLRGIKNWAPLCNFEEIHISEQRKIKLNNLNGEKVKTGESTRKFLHYSEKERIQILFQLLNSSLIDINNAELVERVDLLKIILNKGKPHGIIDEDVKPFLKNIKKLLNPYNFINL